MKASIKTTKQPNTNATMKTNSNPHGKKGRNFYRDIIIIGVLLCLIIGFLIVLNQQNKIQLRIIGHSWQHKIDIEKFGPISEDNWCDNLPVDAQIIRRERQIRSQRPIPAGDKCITVRHDNGDGTFRESQKCQELFKNQPVYDDRCFYNINRWHNNRFVITQGNKQDQTRPWPKVELQQTGQCIGCEREGQKISEYIIYLLVSDIEKKYSCLLPESQWLLLKLNTTLKMPVNEIKQKLQCISLTLVK
ncbi:MAG: hypothetical protein JW841_16315 [Deltaproteobacteria bacterium]|nr:hypothetical protein [Deltaproteobacteria bacterium]